MRNTAHAKKGRIGTRQGENRIDGKKTRTLEKRKSAHPNFKSSQKQTQPRVSRLFSWD